jgi:hypothetical protein
MPRVASSKVQISNLALRHLAAARSIASFDEKSDEAVACAQVYDQVQDEVLRDFPWPFAGRTVSLALVQNQPTPEYGFSYRVPPDCIAVRRILNGGTGAGFNASDFGYIQPQSNFPIGRVATPQSRIKFRIMSDDSGLLLYTDFAPVAATYDTSSPPNLLTPALPQLEYTAEIDEQTFYPPDFCQAMALLMAAYMAPSMTGGDPNKLGARAMNLYQWAIVRAQANAANEETPDLLPESEMMRERL